jgi:rod shape-determining protein MreD
MPQHRPTWRLWIFLWAILALQTTWLARVEFFGARLDLPLLFTLSAALVLGSESGAAFGLVAGVLTGYVSGASLGSFAFSRLVVGAVFGLFDRRFSSDNPFAPPVCAAAATLLASVIFLALSPDTFSPYWLRRVLVECGLNAFFIWPVFLCVNKLVPPARVMI